MKTEPYTADELAKLRELLVGSTLLKQHCDPRRITAVDVKTRRLRVKMLGKWFDLQECSPFHVTVKPSMVRPVFHTLELSSIDHVVWCYQWVLRYVRLSAVKVVDAPKMLLSERSCQTAVSASLEELRAVKFSPVIGRAVVTSDNALETVVVGEPVLTLPKDCTGAHTKFYLGSRFVGRLPAYG